VPLALLGDLACSGASASLMALGSVSSAGLPMWLVLGKKLPQALKAALSSKLQARGLDLAHFIVLVSSLGSEGEAL
jgi:hypothetical protein